jgi:hypothetical protein
MGRGTKAALAIAVASAATVAGSTAALGERPPVRVGALASSAPPCSQGCDVPVGTYRGTNDQGKPVQVHVAVGHLKSGPHIVATVHVIDHFKTEYTIDCGSHKASTKVDTTHWGYINGITGHLRYGEMTMHTLWPPGEQIVGDSSTKSRSCAGTTHFTLHHVAH